jgi:hypothetical protein
MKQEALMNRDQFEVSWKRLKDKLVFRRGKPANDNGKRVVLIGAEISRDVQGGDARTTAFRPDNRRKRDEFSQHMTC